MKTRRRAPATTAPPATLPRLEVPPREALEKVRDVLGPRCRRLQRSLTRDWSGWRAAPLDLGSLSAAALATASGAAQAVDPDYRLIQRATLGWTVVEQQALDEVGAEAWLDRQLHPESIDDGGLEDLLVDALPTIALTPLEIAVQYSDNLEVLFFEFEIATLIRSIYSPRQLHERMTIFWSDHFSIDLFSDFGLYFKQTDDREVIRPNVFGSFHDILSASAHSPAMLDYLTNDSNVAGHPNENYARELMELHSLGVDGVYTEDDVREVARCLTGWSYQPPNPQFGEFWFRADQHDQGPKTVLGEAIAAGGGQADGHQVLAQLAAHQDTERFISRKMLRYLRSYEPSEEEVDRMAAVYRNTGGDLRALTREALSEPELTAAPPKLKRPYHLVVSAARALLAEVDDAFPMIVTLLDAGHLPFTWHPPNGFPDSAGYWSGLLLPRWNFAMQVLAGIRPGLPLATPQTWPEMLEALDQGLLRGSLGESSRSKIESFAGNSALTVDHRIDLLGLVIGSPEFQQY